MKAKNISNIQIKSFAAEVTDLILTGKEKEALRNLKFILERKCPFPKLDLLGREIGRVGAIKPENFFRFFNAIISYKTIGSFVIVGQALIAFLEDNFGKAN